MWKLNRGIVCGSEIGLREMPPLRPLPVETMALDNLFFSSSLGMSEKIDVLLIRFGVLTLHIVDLRLDSLDARVEKRFLIFH